MTISSIEKKRIYFILGPTSSGKTALSIKLSKDIKDKENINCEIVSADSRQIFKDFNLTSGKVTKEEMENIPHHLLDVVEPGQYFSVVDFTNMALQKINEIYERGNIPIVCGGTAFYIDALLYKYNLPDIENDFNLRKELENKNTMELFNILKWKLLFKSLKNPISIFSNFITFLKFSNSEFKNNKHRIVRAIEIVCSLGYIPKLRKIKRFKSEGYQVEIIQTNIDKEILKEKIYKRIVERINTGMIEEVVSVKEKYSLSFKYLEGLGLEFKWIAKFLQNEISKDEMIEKLFIEICQFAKRQNTWFKRYKNF